MESVHYKEKIFLPINNKIIYLNRDDGKVLGEYNLDDVEQITTFNQPGLHDNMLTFVIEDEDWDFNFVTINLDSGKLIDRQISDYEKPSIELKYNNHFFDLNNFGKRLSSYSFAKDDNEIALDWEKSYNQSVSLIGQENGLLYLFDQADNSVFSIKADSGDVVEKKLSLLWPAKADKVKINGELAILIYRNLTFPQQLIDNLVCFVPKRLPVRFIYYVSVIPTLLEYVPFLSKFLENDRGIL